MDVTAGGDDLARMIALDLYIPNPDSAARPAGSKAPRAPGAAPGSHEEPVLLGGIPLEEVLKINLTHPELGHKLARLLVQCALEKVRRTLNPSPLRSTRRP